MLKQAGLVAIILQIATLCACESEAVKAEGGQSSASPPAAAAAEVSQPTPIPYDLAKVKEFSTEVNQLDQEYSKAFASKNLQMFHQAEAKGQALVKKLEAIEMVGLPEHPAYHCRNAAIDITTNRGMAWVTLNSSAATDDDRRIDADNAADTAKEIKACGEAAQAPAKK